MKIELEKTDSGFFIKLYKPHINLNKELEYVKYPIDGQSFTQEELLLFANFIYEGIRERNE